MFGHPNGLFVLAFTEAWERFSYYGLQALLFLYLTRHFLLPDQTAFEVIGAYVSLVFMLPVLGGFLADRGLGHQRAVILGGVLLIFGHLGMAYEGVAAFRQIRDHHLEVMRDNAALQGLYVSLALVATGVGFLKSNISTLVGALYEPGDPRREAGFSVFYMGINLGVLLGPVICGYLGEVWGWRYGFGAAGLGMIFGLLTFLLGRRGLRPPAAPAEVRAVGPHPRRPPRAWPLAVTVSVVVAITFALLQAYVVVGFALLVTGAAVALGVAGYSIARCSRSQQLRHLAAFGLMLLSVFFWSLFAQAGSSLIAFTDRIVDRHFFGVEILTSQFQALNGAFIILLAPIAGQTWLLLARRGRNPSIGTKFTLGISQAGLGFLALVYGQAMAGPGGHVHLLWLVLAYLLLTIGEICVSPIGLSAMSSLSAPAIAGTMMGGWFLATAGAGYIGSLIARLTSVAAPGGALPSLADMSQVYSGLFLKLFWLAAVIAVLAFVIGRIVRRKAPSS